MLKSAVLGRPLQRAQHALVSTKPHARGHCPVGRPSRMVVDDKLVLNPSGDGDTKHLDNISVQLPGKVELFEKTFVVGREESSDIVLPYPTVSGRHAQLNVGPTSIEVTDLDSTNGTYVEGEECEGDKPQVLKVGGEVVFGDLHLACFKLEEVQ